MNHFVLWDIDGTLIYGGGLSGEALRTAMTQYYGPIPTAPFSYAGMTDRQILFQTYPRVPREQLLASFEAYSGVYLRELNQQRNTYRQRGGVQPGVLGLLKRLHADRTIVQSLLTGNIHPAAQIKLEIFNLDQYVDFDVGAFGGDHHDRLELVPFAVNRATERYDRAFTGGEVVVIGDTPSDIACGKVAGARTIGVATGSYSVAQLREAGADRTFVNLADTETVISAIYGEA